MAPWPLPRHEWWRLQRNSAALSLYLQAKSESNSTVWWAQRFHCTGAQLLPACVAVSLLGCIQNSTSLFLNNTVTDTGGAVLVDTQTSTSTLLQVVERITEVNISFKPCFFQVPPEALVEFGDSADRSNAMPGNINASTKVCLGLLPVCITGISGSFFPSGAGSYFVLHSHAWRSRSLFWFVFTTVFD